MRRQVHHEGRALQALFVTIVAVMLVVGLAPHGYRFQNDVEWLEGGAGVRFKQHGVAYTARFLRPDLAAAVNSSGMTVLLALTPSAQQTPSFQFIASLSDGDDSTQMVIAQWGDGLIVMNGDDYSFDRRMPRASADLAPFLGRPFLLAIVTSASGTELLADGEVIGRNQSLQIFVPAGNRSSRLTLGNSAHLDNGWSGAFYGLGLIPRPLTPTELRGYRDTWLKTHELFLAADGPLLSLRFVNGSSGLIHDASGSGGDAVFPAWPTAMERSFLADDPTRGGLDASRVSDVVTNFVGFIPFGLVLAAMLAARGGTVGSIIAAATLSGFLFSLSIEGIQAWIPTRSSSALDLLLNTAGAALGACLWQLRHGDRAAP